MGIYGNFILENYVKNEPDIYYNKDKFDSGEINLCFITGHSGSGKSTMAKNMSGGNIEYYELDDVISNKLSFTMENLKEYGDLIYSFFKGPGKKYYYDKEDIKFGKVKEIVGYEYYLIIDFIKYCKSYAKSHKNKKFIIEGIWLYEFIQPSELKDYAVYIKGTSALLSNIRAANRDSKNDFPDKKDNLKRWKSWWDRFKLFLTSSDGRLGGVSNAKKIESLIQNYRDYFTKIIDKENV